MEKEKQENQAKQILSKIPWKKWDKSQWLIVLLVGVLLLVVVLPVSDAEEEEKQETVTGQEAQDTAGQPTWGEYKKMVEQQLEEILAQVEGVGKVQVMLTLESTGELVVEKDIPQTQSQTEEEDAGGGTRKITENAWEESTVYIQKDGENIPYVVKELVPDIAGVCVIAQGGGNAVVAKNISDAIQALFPIEVHKIKVMKMK